MIDTVSICLGVWVTVSFLIFFIFLCEEKVFHNYFIIKLMMFNASLSLVSFIFWVVFHNKIVEVIS